MSLGKAIRGLVDFSVNLIPYGGLIDVGLEPGEICIICPATGTFGGAAVDVALAMGAVVVAAGRNEQALKALSTKVANPRLKTVVLTGDIATDAEALGPADVWQDWSPPNAAQSSHLKACLTALKVNGRASLMGGIKEDVSLPYGLIMRNNLKVCGKWMYEPDAPEKVMRLVAAGLLKLRAKSVNKFSLERWSEAFEQAAADAGSYSETLLVP